MQRFLFLYNDNGDDFMETNIYTLAHEIKNPLAIAKGYLEMSNERNFSKYKDLINNNINEALSILDNYLEYNKLLLENDIVDIIMLLEEVSDNYCHLFETKIKINSIYDELFIEADFNKLKQVFVNLIKNSIEADSKKIDIYVKYCDDFVTIRLVDDGKGFNNINNLVGYTSKINGHGIGLLITNKIVELHKGSIEYANNEDRGTNILIKLPIKL